MKKMKTFKPQKLGTGKVFSNKKPRPYDTISWVEYRNKFLSANPKCYCCEARSTVVDHWKPWKGDELLFWSETNYIPLCKSHHDFCTGKFDRHNPPHTEDKLRWLNAMRLENCISRKVKVVSIDPKVLEKLFESKK